MATHDVTTAEGLQNACAEAKRRLELNPGDVERIASFLQEVNEVSSEDRQSETFVRRVWDESPLFDLGHGDYDVSAAFADSDFRRRFHELTARHLPTAPSERAVRLDEVLRDTLDLVLPFVPPNSSGGRDRPILKATRVFAALFPNDFTTLHYPGGTLHKRMGGRGLRESPARANRRILDRLDGFIEPANPSDWHSVARHMMLPAILLEILPSEAPPPAPPPPVPIAPGYSRSSPKVG